MVGPLARPLLRIGNAQHAHYPRSDVGVFGRRGQPRNGLRVGALGNRANHVQAASQERRHRLAHRARKGEGRFGGAKKQGRRRSIPSTTLPAPDIEIGSRHPVNRSLPPNRTGICEAVHSRRKNCDGPNRRVERHHRRPAVPTQLTSKRAAFARQPSESVHSGAGRHDNADPARGWARLEVGLAALAVWGAAGAAHGSVKDAGLSRSTCRVCGRRFGFRATWPSLTACG
jgi:hypothetical protein